jgi:hypothetical protein
MIFHPAIIALVVGSFLVTLMLLYSAYYGLVIVRRWDIQSGSELQLDLERRTYLISTLMTYALGFELLSLFLFIYTADHLAPLFVGAMCAAGSLNVNEWGYPAILLKSVNFLLAGVWIIVNHTDNRACDYPLLKKKYLLLLAITPLMVVEALVQGAYFLEMEPDIITSCCGTLFTAEAGGVSSGIVALPRIPVETAFFASMATTLAVGVYFYLKGKAGYLFSVSSLLTFVLSVVALISFVSLYFYELPTHHCPFCILQKEYHYVGYPLYFTFLAGGVAGLGLGAILPLRQTGSLKEIIPAVQKELALVILISFTLFTLIVLYGMAFSNLRLEGY